MSSTIATAQEGGPAASAVDAAFRSLDADSDGSLTVDEFLASDKERAGVLRRDFLVFDADGDGRLNPNEFRAIPHGGPEESQGPVVDPVIELSRSAAVRLADQWDRWDADHDGRLNSAEFTAAQLSRQVSGLEETTFKDWDRDSDGQISKDDAFLLLDIAFGVRIPSGEFLRASSGRVIDYITYRGQKRDARGIVSRADYIAYLGAAVPNPEEWFKGMDKNEDGEFNFAEFATGNHRTDPVGMFLGLDADLDGRLSLKELLGLPVAWRQMAEQALPGFDDDGDGMYSLREYQLLPHVNLLAVWQAAQDADSDGRLSPGEFRFMPAPDLAALSAEYFRRLDTNHDGYLNIEEWSFHTSNADIVHDARFKQLDKDFDGALSEIEFLAVGIFPQDRLHRDFLLFDADQDGKFSLLEFASISYIGGDDSRAQVPSPVVRLSESRLAELKRSWNDWDRDGSGQLSAQEFSAAGLQRRIPGLELTSLRDWDRNRDGQLSLDEAALLLDVAFGVRTTSGDFLRSGSGKVVDWNLFRVLRQDHHGMVSRDEYFRVLGALPNREDWLRSIDKNGDGQFGYQEFSLGNHRTDPVNTFLALDKDLDGQLSAAELDGIEQPSWREMAQVARRGFDENGDGLLSLMEFQLLPHVNVLAGWQSAQDRNNDGVLSLSEFNFVPAPALAALTAEYFRRLDVDHDEKLNIAEWTFAIDVARVPRDVVLKLRDRDRDGLLSLAEVQGELRLQATQGQTNAGVETALVRIEEAFQRADLNQDGLLDLAELSTDEGLEAVAPGAAVQAKSTPLPPAIAIGNFLGMDEDSVRTYAIVGFNLLLVAGVGIYLLRSQGRKND